MTPTQYEDYIGTLFAQKGYAVTVSPLSNDWGIDVMAIKGYEKIGIQSKMYGQSNRSVNRRVIMELYGAAAYQDCTKAVLATDGDIMPDTVMVAEKLGIEIILTTDGEAAARLFSSQTEIPSQTEEKSSVNIPVLSFDEAWGKYIIPLAGQTLRNSRGTNYISSVDWSGIKRITSNGISGHIDIEGFRLAYNTLIRQRSITRDYINQQINQRCSSGIVLILGQIPFIEMTSSPSGLRLKHAI